MNQKALISSIHKHRGVISKVAKEMKVSRQAIYKAKKKWETVAAAIEDARDTFKVGALDMAELQLVKAIKAGAPWAIKYMLSTLGRERGYSQKQEVAHSGRIKPITMVMDLTDS